MNERTSTGILASIFFVLLFLTVHAYFFAPTRGVGPIRRTPLVMPSQKDVISSVSIVQGESSVELVRKDNGWFIKQERFLYPASAKKIDMFLDELIKERNVMTVSKSGPSDFGIGIQGASSVRLQEDDGTIVADIDFGDVNAAGTDIFFRTGRDIAILQTTDSFTPLLDSRTASWAELSPFIALTRQTAIQRVIYETSKGKTILQAGRESEEIAAFTSALESLVCLDVAGVSSAFNERIDIELGNLEAFSISFASDDASVYIMTDSRSGLSYIVSKWSHDRLVNTLKK
jgi:hypothetical protein